MTSTTLSYAKPHSPRATLNARPHLVVALECGAPLAGASRHELGATDEVTIGRDAARSFTRAGARLDLKLPDARMSGSHARIVRRGETFVLEDARSKNGVFVNGARTSRADLEDGDVFLLGETLFLFRSALLCDALDRPDVTVRSPTPLSTLIPELGLELDALSQIAGSAVSILILGATGTGKEVAARAVHGLSNRAGRFVAFNCGAIPSNLVEDSLFGHKKGAFSGAITDEPGFLRSAHRGTVLMDEIGDLPTLAQAALLRVLQESEVVPVGSAKADPVDLRVIAATHRDLDALVKAGSFREDLLARLSGFTFHLPTLAERREDLGLITGSILGKLGDANGRAYTLAPEAGLALFLHRWPQNIRELEKCLARAVVLATTGRIEAQHLGLPARSNDDESQRATLLALLAQHKGNLAAVAKAMATSRAQVHRLLKRLGIDAEGFRG
jgi:hypothetical protein